MRYAIYWLPDKQTSLYELSRDWFNQSDKFQALIEQKKKILSYYDFEVALKIPKKYGFHAEILPPFTLNFSFDEYNIFKICNKIAKKKFYVDIKMHLIIECKSLLLHSIHKNNCLTDMRQQLYTQLSTIATFDPIINLAKNDSICCQQDFQIVLSNHIDVALQSDLKMIAHLYWQNILKKFLTIQHFNLCCQKDKDNHFVELARFNLSLN